MGLMSMFRGTSRTKASPAPKAAPIKVKPKGKTTSYVATDKGGKQRRLVMDEDSNVYLEKRNTETGEANYRNYGSFHAQSPIKTSLKRDQPSGSSRTGMSYFTPEAHLTGALSSRGISLEREGYRKQGFDYTKDKGFKSRPAGHTYTGMTPGRVASPSPKAEVKVKPTKGAANTSWDSFDGAGQKSAVSAPTPTPAPTPAPQKKSGKVKPVKRDFGGPGLGSMNLYPVASQAPSAEPGTPEVEAKKPRSRKKTAVVPPPVEAAEQLTSPVQLKKKSSAKVTPVNGKKLGKKKNP